MTTVASISLLDQLFLNKTQTFENSIIREYIKLRFFSTCFMIEKKVFWPILHSSDPPFLKWGILMTSLGGGQSEKFKKGSGSMVQGQVLLKGGWGCWYFSYLIFSRFIIFIFRNYFTLCKIVLCIWRKTIFFCHHNFMKKVILSCLKMNLKISHKLR